jgi:hypothetical protein
MAARVQITLDPETRRHAQDKAAALGISFAEYVRRLLAQDLDLARRNSEHTHQSGPGGCGRESASELIREGHSETFRLFHRAILERKQITCTYKGVHREICPHILGHTQGQEKALVYQFGGSSRSRAAR